MTFSIIVEGGTKYVQDSTDQSKVPLVAQMDIQNGYSVRLVAAQQAIISAINDQISALNIEALNSEAAKLDSLISGIGALANYLSSIDQNLQVQGVQFAADVLQEVTYLDEDTPNQRIGSVTYTSVSLGQAVTETYTYAGAAGNYRLDQITRSLAEL